MVRGNSVYTEEFIVQWWGTTLKSLAEFTENPSLAKLTENPSLTKLTHNPSLAKLTQVNI